MRKQEQMSSTRRCSPEMDQPDALTEPSKAFCNKDESQLSFDPSQQCQPPSITPQSSEAGDLSQSKLDNPMSQPHLLSSPKDNVSTDSSEGTTSPPPPARAQSLLSGLDPMPLTPAPATDTASPKDQEKDDILHNHLIPRGETASFKTSSRFASQFVPQGVLGNGKASSGVIGSYSQSNEPTSEINVLTLIKEIGASANVSCVEPQQAPESDLQDKHLGEQIEQQQHHDTQGGVVDVCEEKRQNMLSSSPKAKVAIIIPDSKSSASTYNASTFQSSASMSAPISSADPSARTTTPWNNSSNLSAAVSSDCSENLLFGGHMGITKAKIAEIEFENELRSGDAQAAAAAEKHKNDILELSCSFQKTIEEMMTTYPELYDVLTVISSSRKQKRRQRVLDSFHAILGLHLQRVENVFNILLAEHSKTMNALTSLQDAATFVTSEAVSCKNVFSQACSKLPACSDSASIRTKLLDCMRDLAYELKGVMANEADVEYNFNTLCNEAFTLYVGKLNLYEKLGEDLFSEKVNLTTIETCQQLGGSVNNNQLSISGKESNFSETDNVSIAHMGNRKHQHIVGGIKMETYACEEMEGNSHQQKFPDEEFMMEETFEPKMTNKKRTSARTPTRSSQRTLNKNVSRNVNMVHTSSPISKESLRAKRKNKQDSSKQPDNRKRLRSQSQSRRPETTDEIMETFYSNRPTSSAKASTSRMSKKKKGESLQTLENADMSEEMKAVVREVMMYWRECNPPLAYFNVQELPLHTHKVAVGGDQNLPSELYHLPEEVINHFAAFGNNVPVEGQKDYRDATGHIRTRLQKTYPPIRFTQPAFYSCPETKCKREGLQFSCFLDLTMHYKKQHGRDPVGCIFCSMLFPATQKTARQVRECELSHFPVCHYSSTTTDARVVKNTCKFLCVLCLLKKKVEYFGDRSKLLEHLQHEEKYFAHHMQVYYCSVTDRPASQQSKKRDKIQTALMSQEKWQCLQCSPPPAPFKSFFEKVQHFLLKHRRKIYHCYMPAIGKPLTKDDPQWGSQDVESDDVLNEEREDEGGSESDNDS